MQYNSERIWLKEEKNTVVTKLKFHLHFQIVYVRICFTSYFMWLHMWRCHVLCILYRYYVCCAWEYHLRDLYHVFTDCNYWLHTLYALYKQKERKKNRRNIVMCQNICSYFFHTFHAKEKNHFRLNNRSFCTYRRKEKKKCICRIEQWMVCESI